MVWYGEAFEEQGMLLISMCCFPHESDLGTLEFQGKAIEIWICQSGEGHRRQTQA